jgi:hypothetical protein
MAFRVITQGYRCAIAAIGGQWSFDNASNSGQLYAMAGWW